MPEALFLAELEFLSIAWRIQKKKYPLKNIAYPIR
jgi:hypothetical protein